MAFQPGAVVYTQGMGSRPESVEVPHIEGRSPTQYDTGAGLFPIGKSWVNSASNTAYVLTSFSSSGGVLASNWEETTGGGDAITDVEGTASQIDVSTTSGVATLSLDSALILPGTLTANALITANAALDVSSGDITVDSGNLTVTSGVIDAGSDINISGNMNFQNAGNFITYPTTSDPTFGAVGQATLTDGAVTVTVPSMPATPAVFMSRNGDAGINPLGELNWDVSGTTLILQSLNPTTGLPQTGDSSTVFFFIMALE